MILPLLSLLTIFGFLATLELVSTLIFPRSGTGFLACITNDATGVRGIPHTVCEHRLAEGESAEYRFNSCGDRTAIECGPKPPGTYRIVAIGSSIVFGYGVSVDQSWASLLPRKLSQLTGRPVELYNKGAPWAFPHTVDQRFDEALAQKPDMILWMLAAADLADLPAPDLGSARDPAKASGGHSARFLVTVRDHMHTAFAGRSILAGISSIWQQSRSALLLEHLLYEVQTQYIKSYLLRRDPILDAQPSARWKAQLHRFESEIADVEARSQAAGVPFVATLLPTRAQAAMLAVGTWPKSIDPYRLDNDLRAIVTRHGGTFVDLFPAFRNIPNAERDYMPVDGHPNTRGHAVLASLLAAGLTDAVPALHE